MLGGGGTDGNICVVFWLINYFLLFVCLTILIIFKSISISVLGFGVVFQLKNYIYRTA